MLKAPSAASAGKYGGRGTWTDRALAALVDWAMAIVDTTVGINYLRGDKNRPQDH